MEFWTQSFGWITLKVGGGACQIRVHSRGWERKFWFGLLQVGNAAVGQRENGWPVGQGVTVGRVLSFDLSMSFVGLWGLRLDWTAAAKKI